MTLTHAADAWRAAGYTCLPAAADGSKTPAVPTWRQWQHTAPTPAEYAAMPTTGGIGLLCGATSGNLEMLEIEGAALHLLPDITTAMADHNCADLWQRIITGYSEQTPGGGVHWLYRVDGPARPNTKLARRPKPGGVQVLIETRGQGGWTIIAPSNGTTHPTGGAWTCLSGGPDTVATLTEEERDTVHAILALFDQMPVAAAPTPTTPLPPSGQTRPGDDYNARADWADILTGWTRVRRMGQGFAWRRPGKNVGISATTGQADDGVDRLYVFTTSTVLPAETPLSKFAAYTHLHHAGDYASAARELKRQGYGQEHVDDGPDLSDMLAGDYNTPPDDTDPDDPHAATKQRFPRLDWHALWADQTEEEWVLEPILPARRLVALYSAPKVGKSLLLLEMAVGISCGRETLGATPPRPFRVLYVDFENDPKGDVRARLQAMGHGPDDLDNLYYLSFPTLAALDSPMGGQQLLAAIAAYGAEVVVIDTVSRAVAGDENENDTWLNFYRHTGLMLKQAQVALIRLDHSGKDEAKGQRGGSAKSGDVDAIWRMSKLNDTTFELVCDASRIHITEKHLTIHRETNPTLRHRVDAKGQAAAFTIRVADLIAWLDANNIPQDASVRTTKDVMKAKGRGVDSAVVAAAVKRRKGHSDDEDWGAFNHD